MIFGSQIESQLVDLILNEGTRVEFEVTGKKFVHICLHKLIACLS